MLREGLGLGVILEGGSGSWNLEERAFGSCRGPDVLRRFQEVLFWPSISGLKFLRVSLFWHPLHDVE